MSFPPRDVIQDQMLFYRLSGIADDVNKVIAGAGLTAEVGHTKDLLQYVKVSLQHGGAVSLVAHTRSPGAWMIVWPETPTSDGGRMAWPLDTDHDVLVEIFSAGVHVAAQGRELPTPFRWGRVDNSTIVQLADNLLAGGVDRGALYLTPLRTLDDDGHPRAARGDLNELRLADNADPDRTLVVRFEPKHGWSVDQVMPQAGGSGRLDLAPALGLKPLMPRVTPDAVDLRRLARLLVEDTFWVDVPDDDQRRLVRYAETPREDRVDSKSSALRAATAWLRWAGFVYPATRRSRSALTPAVELHVDYSQKQVGLAGVQRYKGIAAVSDRTPVVIARSGFSKNARTWSDTAAMLLFTIEEDGLLRPSNGLAAAFTPVEIGHRPSDCDDPACQTLGCVLDDEACPSAWGTFSDPNAERLRL